MSGWCMDSPPLWLKYIHMNRSFSALCVPHVRGRTRQLGHLELGTATMCVAAVFTVLYHSRRPTELTRRPIEAFGSRCGAVLNPGVVVSVCVCHAPNRLAGLASGLGWRIPDV
eukprot:2103468-Prymnesium_polylepis.1